MNLPNPAAPIAPGEVVVEGGASAEPRSRLQRMADSLPDWMGSIRFRLTALYSLVLFGLAAIMVLGLYLVLANRLHHDEAYKSYPVDEVQPIPGGFQITRRQMVNQAKVVEHLANERALSLLRTYSLTAVGLLFIVSLATGWFVAGRVLAPIGRITGVAREIQATDLSRRIALRGPPDELTELADTFDAMLARLDDAFESQQRFIQEASHELRNPLAVIRTNLDVLLADPDADPAELRRVSELVLRTTARMAVLVDDLLEYGRRGAPIRELGPVDLAPLVREAADEFAVPAAQRHLSIDVAAPPQLVISGDRVALRQAVSNLLGNAVRLAPEGSRIVLATGEDERRRWISVSDDGPGIAPEHREHVFQRFWRGDPDQARQSGRSGLGLAIVDQIARDHQGSVDVVPSPTGGSTFTISLPRH
jgi:signal transduction histidine kinase